MKTLCLAVSIALSTATASALRAQTSTAPNATRVTVTGCVQRAAAQTPAGTSGHSATPASGTRFVLTTPNVESKAGTTGTTATASNVVYRLDESDPAKISAHEGQKVEVTGTVEKSSTADENTSAAATTAPTPKLHVESITTVSSTCSQ